MHYLLPELYDRGGGVEVCDVGRVFSKAVNTILCGHKMFYSNTSMLIYGGAFIINAS